MSLKKSLPLVECLQFSASTNLVSFSGSATGVGAATALLLAEKGCNVVINYTKSRKEAEETMEACKKKGVGAILVQGDISSDDDCKRLAEECYKAFGRIDYLVK